MRRVCRTNRNGVRQDEGVLEEQRWTLRGPHVRAARVYLPALECSGARSATDAAGEWGETSRPLGDEEVADIRGLIGKSFRSLVLAT